MNDKCIVCGNDVSDLGVLVCPNCENSDKVVICKKCAFFVGSEYSNVGFCTMNGVNKLNLDTCEYAERSSDYEDG